MMIARITLAVIFLILAGFHFYWALGGKQFLKAVVPKNNYEDSITMPKWYYTIFVGVVLMLLGGYYLCLPHQLYILKYTIPILFMIRVVGDFKYVGLFKTVKSTLFAKRDQQVFIPICFLIALLGIYVIYKS